MIQDDYANILIDYVPHREPQYTASYFRKEGLIVLRFGQMQGRKWDDGRIGMVINVILHESLHCTIQNIIEEDIGYKHEDDFKFHEWPMACGLDYTEGLFVTRSWYKKYKEYYTECSPKAFEFRTTFDEFFIEN
jgi:hypothetical protein